MFFRQENVVVRLDEVSAKHLPPFGAANDTLDTGKQSLLIYHITADGGYVCADKTISVGAGHLTYLPPHTQYRPLVTREDAICIAFDILSGDRQTPDDMVTQYPEKFRVLFEKLLTLQKGADHTAGYQQYAVFYQILAEAKNEVTQVISIPKLIQPSIEYINKNFSNPKLTIAEIARASHISEVYFRQLFKKTMRQLPGKYLFRLRIERASILLQSTKLKVEEIAAMSGFTDTKYFMTSFRKATGFSPQKYRQFYGSNNS